MLPSYRDAQLALAESAAAGAPAQAQSSRAPRARIDDEARSAETVQRQLALPWAGLIETLESAASADVALLQMQPDALQRVLRLSAEARHHDAMFEYLRRLAAAPAFTAVHLVSHQVQVEEPQRPVQFSVQAALKSAP
jgi:Tfp pilus assembly protein PilN